MRHIAPWPDPTTASASYCQAVTGWTILDTTNASAEDKTKLIGCANPQTAQTPECQALFRKYTFNVWSSDHVFCLQWTSNLWQVLLYLALVAWIFLTAVSILQTFEWRGMTGYTLSELVKTVGRQMALIVAACLSFSMLLAIHQVLFLGVNSLLGGLPQWRVESEWTVLVKLVSQSQAATQNLDPNGAVDQIFGGNLPDSSGPFGMSWGQITGGLGSLDTFLVAALVPIRFVAMFVAVCCAPLAILCWSTNFTRRLFHIWLFFWAELEGLALLSACILAAYQQLHNKFQGAQVASTEQAFILLALCGLACGANLVFLYKILGQFLGNITAYYQQQYQRERQLVSIALQTAVGALGAITTALSGGAALPAALAAEGLVSGATNLGATPGGAVPGAGVGQAFIGVGRAAAQQQHQQAQEAERAARTQLQDDRYQAGRAEQAAYRQVQEQRYQAAQTRLQAQDTHRAAAEQHAEERAQATQVRWLNHEKARVAIGLGTASPWPGKRDDHHAAGPAGGLVGGTPRNSGPAGNAGGPAPVPGPAPAYNNRQAPPQGTPPAPPPLTPHQQAGDFMRQAPVERAMYLQILRALPPGSKQGLQMIKDYVLAVHQDPGKGQATSPTSMTLLKALRGLAHPAAGGTNDDQ